MWAHRGTLGGGAEEANPSQTLSQEALELMFSHLDRPTHRGRSRVPQGKCIRSCPLCWDNHRHGKAEGSSRTRQRLPAERHTRAEWALKDEVLSSQPSLNLLRYIIKKIQFRYERKLALAHSSAQNPPNVPVCPARHNQSYSSHSCQHYFKSHFFRANGGSLFGESRFLQRSRSNQRRKHGSSIDIFRRGHSGWLWHGLSSADKTLLTPRRGSIEA